MTKKQAGKVDAREITIPFKIENAAELQNALEKATQLVALLQEAQRLIESLKG